MDDVRKRAKKLEYKGITEFIKLQHYFFRDINVWIVEVIGSRNESYITYTQQELVWLGIFKNEYEVEGMRRMNETFNEKAALLSCLS